MTGLNKYDDKMKREQRRRNHIARDLRTPKYRQRVEKRKDKYKDGIQEDDEGE